eukprot:CFRG5611T1
MTKRFDPEEKERSLHAQALSWNTSSPRPALPGDIPFVDVGPYFASNSLEDLHAAANALRTACEDVGFYQLINHGISCDQFTDILLSTKRFHALDVDIKRTILMDKPGINVRGTGYLPVGERKLPQREKGNANEAFLIKTSEQIKYEDNQWPAEDILPGFQSSVKAYNDSMTQLALRLLPVYAVALDLDPDYFEPAFKYPLTRLRMTHYPPQHLLNNDDCYVDRIASAGKNIGKFGIAPHVDTTFFTLLLQNSPGLTVYSTRRKEWIAVPVVDQALVVNTGELLRQWSNDRFLSARHFANNVSSTGADTDISEVNTTSNTSFAANDGARYSVPYFFNATNDYPMSCLPSCHGPDNPPKYPTISYLQSQGVIQGE